MLKNDIDKTFTLGIRAAVRSEGCFQWESTSKAVFYAHQDPIICLTMVQLYACYVGVVAEISQHNSLVRKKHSLPPLHAHSHKQSS